MNTITKAAYEGDIVSRLRNWRGLHLAHGGRLYEEAADEIARLRGYRDAAEADRSVAMLAAERLRLTAEERDAVEWAAIAADKERQHAVDAADRGYKPDGGGNPRAWADGHSRRSATLRKLLGRMQ